MKHRLGIIGSGSAGIISACHFLTWLENSWEVILIHDPNTPILGIGESTNANFVSTLETAVDFTFDDLPYLDGTLKFGTQYYNWRDTDWTNPLIEGSVAIHFNTFKFKDYVFPRLKDKWGTKFSVTEGIVNNVDQDLSAAYVTVDNQIHKFDFIIDCRGFPETQDEYVKSNCSLINHRIVYDSKKFNPIQYTEHHATKNGWMFGVPLSTRCSYGYMYNDKITSKDDAIADMAELLDIPRDELTVREYSFAPYYAKKVLDGKILKNGNRALFLEPLSATSIYMYINICQMFVRVLTGKYSEVDINQEFRNTMEDLEILISYFYHGGSTHNTEFWNRAKDNAISKLKESYKFHWLIESLTNAYNKGTPYDFQGMIFPPVPWVKVDKYFQYNYFTGKNTFKFDMEKVLRNQIMADEANKQEIIDFYTSKNEVSRDVFKSTGYVHLKKILDKDTVDLVSEYALNDHMQNFSPEAEGQQIPGTHSKYADPLMEALLKKLHPVMETATGLTLHPTYSYYRVYKTGDVLKPHVDRDSCEISTTVCFNFDYKELQGKYDWPIWMVDTPVVMEPGDIVIYHGCELTHWRDEFEVPEGSWHVQAFFHYVDANGKRAECKFDKRPQLGYRADRINVVDQTLPATSGKKYITYTD